MTEAADTPRERSEFYSGRTRDTLSLIREAVEATRSGAREVYVSQWVGDDRVEIRVRA